MNPTPSPLRLWSASLLAITLIALPGARANSRDNGELRHGDRKFILNAAEGGANEVALSRIALERSQDSQVRDLARKMVADHEALNLKVRALAQRKGVDIGEAVQKGEEHDVDSLRKKAPADFDKAYLDDMLSGHKDTIDLFEKTALDSRDWDISTLASETLPTLFQHYRHVRRLDHREDREDRYDRDRDASPSVPPPTQ